MSKLRTPLFSEEDYHSGIDHRQLAQVRQRFQRINDNRIRLMHESLRGRQRDFLEALPILLHVNHPLLPGWINYQVPNGIVGYKASSEGLHYLKKLSRSITIEDRAAESGDILGVFLIGSTGTIAQNENSDLDVWVVYRENLEHTARQKLAEKVNKIQLWGNQQGADAHCFLMSPDYFRDAQVKLIESDENCGSAQHYLLLEEFYRTGLLLAGLFPLWWLVPPEEEENYGQYASNLLNNKHVKHTECIDFGGIPGIPAEEFLGAALWQLHKSIESPYKSVLKIILMEYYASRHPDVKPLCFTYKESVYSGETSLEKIDPYVMIYACIEDYLGQQNAWQRLELIRRCFYVKTAPNLSSAVPSGKDSKQLLRQVTDKWRWTNDKFAFLDNRLNWRALDVVKERQALMNELNHCYQFLSKFAAINHSIAHISYEDLTLLGRKLFASFERKSGKVEFINPGITQTITETHLSFKFADKESYRGWALFVFDQLGNALLLKKSPSLCDLITYCVINGIYDKQTQIQVQPGASGIELTQVNNLLHFVSDIIYKRTINKNIDAFSDLARLEHCVFIINLGCDVSSSTGESGFQIISDQSDALNYGRYHSNLVQGVDMITVNSWNEVYVSHYEGERAIIAALCECLNQLGDRNTEPPGYYVWSCHSNHSGSIRQRASQLLNDIFWHYFDNTFKGIGRYVMSLSDQLVLLEYDAGHTTYSVYEAESELWTALGYPLLEYTPVVIDSKAQVEELYRVISSANRKNTAQLFYYLVSEKVYFYLLDELGCFYSTSEDAGNPEESILHYLHFIERIMYKNSASQHQPALSAIEVIEVIWDRPSQSYHLNWKQDFYGAIPERVHFVQAIGVWTPYSSIEYDFFCEDVHFSHREHGDALYASVAEYVMSKRGWNRDYPVYLSDLELKSQGDQNNWSTSILLRYKSLVEAELNQALKKLQ